jgi:hypothetical protein
MRYQRQPRRPAAGVNFGFERLGLPTNALMQDNRERLMEQHRGLACLQQLPCAGRMTWHERLSLGIHHKYALHPSSRLSPLAGAATLTSPLARVMFSSPRL